MARRDQPQIHIPRWDDFQHYKDRDPPWIKTYRSQLDNDIYLDLTFAQRGLLHDLRLLYLMTHANVTADARKLSRRLNGRVTNAQLAALNDAGLIVFGASRPLAQRREELEDSWNSNGEPPRDPDAVRRMQELAQTILGERIQ